MTRNQPMSAFEDAEADPLTCDERHEFAREMILAGRLWRNRLSERLKAFGMTPPSWAALYWLSQAQEGISQTTLAERAGLEPATLVRILDQLQAQGLVERRPCMRDRRINLLHITAAAGPMVLKINEIADEVRFEAMVGLDPHDVRTAIAVLRKLRPRLG